VQLLVGCGKVNAPGPATEPHIMAHLDALNLPLLLGPQMGSFTQVEGAAKVGWGGHTIGWWCWANQD
jgi:hypothetical protein